MEYGEIKTDVIERKIRKNKVSVAVEIIIALHLLIILGMSYFVYHQETQFRQQSLESKEQFNRYLDQLKKEQEVLDSISKNYPSQMTYEVYSQYVDDYTSQAAVVRQRLIELRDFVSRKEIFLQASGVDTFQMKNDIDIDLSNIDKNIEFLELELKNMKENL
jgi:type II secretory pathway component PulL